MRTNYILIDFENIQPTTLGVLRQDYFRVLVFVGAGQTKVPFEIAATLQSFGPRAEYVKVEGAGPNALDFHIAFYIGQLAAREPDSYFHIISKDRGFDPLIRHLKQKGISCVRAISIDDIAIVRTATTKSHSGRVSIVVERLTKPKPPRPRTLKTLANSISATFQKQLSPQEIEAIQQDLVSKGLITIEGTKITYSIPATDPA